MGVPFSGGAGIRTPVRDKINHGHYVRSPPIKVCERWPVGDPLPHKPPKISRGAKRRDDPLSRYCDTRKNASGGASSRARRITTKRYAARAKLLLAVMVCRGFSQDPAPGHAAIVSPTPSKPCRPRRSLNGSQSQRHVNNPFNVSVEVVAYKGLSNNHLRLGGSGGFARPASPLAPTRV